LDEHLNAALGRWRARGLDLAALGGAQETQDVGTEDVELGRDVLLAAEKTDRLGLAGEHLRVLPEDRKRNGLQERDEGCARNRQLEADDRVEVSAIIGFGGERRTDEQVGVFEAILDLHDRRQDAAVEM